MHVSLYNISPRFPPRPLVLLVLFLGLFVQLPVFGADVESVRLLQTLDRTRLVFDLSGSISYDIFDLNNPDRVVIDIADAELSTDFARLDYSNSPIKSIRSAARNGNGLRIVVDLVSMVDHSSFTQAANGDLQDRLVLDLLDSSNADITTARTVPARQQRNQRSTRKAVLWLG